jgi:beta-galactosidase
VTTTGATARNGRRFRFVHNWSWDPVTVRIPTPVRDLRSNRDCDAGNEVELGAWDVRVFVEREGT